ncbi:helix-turn-helix domain-containing protein [Raoultella ornithinolytica]|uniref:MarR family transcriptional regulator n=1 Tax=Raoultella ornithinolytica TaxID=54291 RepID=UPI002E129279|nr:helix-turn-helix domain-containing protein [Raoultella ornithinolytica]WKL86188.1 helix-turn-helix domain-containing protein [Raoultella ornithinolytica]
MKTTKSKTQQTSEIPMLDFIAANPDMTAAEIASALNRRMPSVSGQIRQLRGMHRIIPGGLRDGVTVWRINDMPFGCGNRERLMFETLLREHRGAAR